MKDGLYLVDRAKIYAAFVVRGGEVTICAPILRNNLSYYKQIAKYVPTEGDSEPEQEDMYPPPCRVEENIP